MISIRIVHVVYSFGIGGLEKGITTLINHGSDGIAHIIISLCGTKDSEKLLKKPAQIICLDKPGGNSPRFIWDLAKPAVRQEMGVLPDDFVVGIVARLDAIKNHGALIDAVNQVAQSRPGVKLVVVGDGPEAATLKARAGDHVRFLGYRSDTARLMQGVDLFVLPSFNEGISNTILEAMATGLPVIASNVGGNPELVCDEENGRLIDPEEPGQMANIIGQYIESTSLCKLHGTKGRKRMIERFSVASMVRQYESVYRETTRINKA